MLGVSAQVMQSRPGLDLYTVGIQGCTQVGAGYTGVYRQTRHPHHIKHGVYRGYTAHRVYRGYTCSPYTWHIVVCIQVGYTGWLPTLSVCHGCAWGCTARQANNLQIWQNESVPIAFGMKELVRCDGNEKSFTFGPSHFWGPVTRFSFFFHILTHFHTGG